MASATMDLYTILDTTEEMGHIGQLLTARGRKPNVSTEEDDALGFEVCIELQDRLRARFQGEALTADRFKGIVSDTIEEMIKE